MQSSNTIHYYSHPIAMSLILTKVVTSCIILCMFFVSLPCAAMSKLLEDRATMPSVIFLLDKSRSIGKDLFDSVKRLLAENLKIIAGNDVQIGVVSFSSNSSVDVPLQLWNNTLHKQISKIPYFGKGSNIHLAIDAAISELEPEGTRIIVLFSDGEATDPDAAKAAANKAKEAGILIYTVGIGEKRNWDELKKLSPLPPRNDSSASIENHLQDITKLIISKLESGGKYYRDKIMVANMSIIIISNKMFTNHRPKREKGIRKIKFRPRSKSRSVTGLPVHKHRATNPRQKSPLLQWGD